MAIPRRGWIEIPLLLELERAGGKAKKDAALYGAVARHFLLLSDAEKATLEHRVGETTWGHKVDWERFELKRKGEVSGERGVWEITDRGQRRLRRELTEIGVPATDVNSFIRGNETLPQRLGGRWSPLSRVQGGSDAKGLRAIGVDN